MTRAEYFLERIEFSSIRVELAHSNLLKTTWLRINQSYRHLLVLETQLAAEQGLGVTKLLDHEQAGDQH
jgi:hypothetical protein